MVTAPRKWSDVAPSVRAGLVAGLRKRADDKPSAPPAVPGVADAADVLGWRAGPINAYWGGPRPVTNLLIGSALGALGGYGVGRLAETVLPERYFRRGSARRRGALLGGLLGAAPAAWQAFDNVRQTGDVGAVADPWPTKAAADLFDPVIHTGRFSDAVFADPNTPLQLRAATSGLVEAGAAVGGSDLVSPWSIARVAVGAGAGLVSGVIAGKALGLLAGLTPEAQQRIQQAGLWAGVLKSVVPPALGLRL